MNSQYSFFLNNEAKGPFTREQALAMIAGKEVLPDTPCAPSGAAEWQPASQIFDFSAPASAPTGGVRLSIKGRNVPAAQSVESAPASNVPVNVPADEERPSLDPEIRRKVIRLGIADAATIDKLTLQQAESAIRAHEENLKKENKTKQLAAVAGLVAAGALGFVFFNLTAPGKSVCDSIAGMFVKDSAKFNSEKEKISKDRGVLESKRKELAELKFSAPENGREGKAFFDSRVVIPRQKATALTFSANVSKLKEISSNEPKFISLKSLPYDIKREMDKNASMVWKYSHPAELTDPLTPEELKASWELFKKQTGDKIPKFVAENTADTAQKQENGEYTIGSAVFQNIVAVVETSDGVPVYFPYGDGRPVSIKVVQQQALTHEEALADEVYAVTQKETTGGGICGLKVNAFDSHYMLKRPMPTRYFLGLAREGIDRSPVWIDVTPEEFQNAKTGDEYPTRKLFAYTAYDRPEAVKLPGAFELIKSEK